jgi:multidrug efflux pump subunit AcrA (membrane-fusion protein)
MSTKRAIVLILIGTALVASGCTLGKQPTPTPIIQAEFVPVISVTGELLPALWTTVSHKQGGRVTKVLIEPGDKVAAGQALLHLDTTYLEISLQAAREQVSIQQAALSGLLLGASREVIARADRDHDYQLAQAEIVLRIKERQLAQAKAQDPRRDVTAAELQTERLEKQLFQSRAQDPSAEVTLAQIELERAQIALEDTQDEYNKALDRPWEDQAIRDGWAKQLEQAQLNHRLAEARLAAALSARSAHAASLDVLGVQMSEAEVQLAKALDAQKAYSLTLTTLNDEIEAAKLDLAHLRAWENPYRDEPTAPEVERAEAAVRQAQSSVEQIEQQIDDATVRAPFAGVAGIVSVRMNEVVSPGQPLLTVGDLDTMRVETTDLDEIDVVGVSLGQKVAVTFDALPDQVMDGQVTRISPMAEPGSGGVHYTVIVELDEIDPALRWGMTAFVDIESEQ